MSDNKKDSSWIGDGHAASSYTPVEQATADQLVAENYDLLADIARAKRRRDSRDSTLSTIDILHESYLRLNGRPAWNSSEHFLRSATLAMRCVIVDHARRKQTRKRGAGAVPLSVEDESLLPEFGETPEQVVAIAELMDQLAAVHPAWMLVVDARYFGGLTEAEAAQALGLSPRTVRRHWHEARGWLARKLGVAY